MDRCRSSTTLGNAPSNTRATARCPLSFLRRVSRFFVRGDQLNFDVGKLAPDHLPPHAHADTLAVVAWFDGRPVLVDTGAYTYTGPERDAFRGTAGHNTLELDGVDQCEFWGDFRLAFPPAVSQNLRSISAS